MVQVFHKHKLWYSSPPTAALCHTKIQTLPFPPPPPPFLLFLLQQQQHSITKMAALRRTKIRQMAPHTTLLQENCPFLFFFLQGAMEFSVQN